MLALPVERLVGNTSSHDHRPRMSMSPDSSASDSSNISESLSSSNTRNTSNTNAKVFSAYASQLVLQQQEKEQDSPPLLPPQNINNSPPHSINNDNDCKENNSSISPSSPPNLPTPCFSLSPTTTKTKVTTTKKRMSSGHCLISSTSGYSTDPSHSVSIKMSPHQSPTSYFYEDDHECQEEDKKPLLKIESSNNNNDNSPSGVSPYNDSKSSSSSCRDSHNGGKEYNNNNNNTKINTHIMDPDRRERESGKNRASLNITSAPSNPTLLSASQNMTIRTIEVQSAEDNGLDDGVEDNSRLGPKSTRLRPSSRSSSSSSSSTTSFISSSPYSPHAILHEHRNSHSSSRNSHKFSIDDILRPEFGKGAIQQINHHRVRSNSNNRRNSRNSITSLSFSGEYLSSDSSKNHISCSIHRNRDGQSQHVNNYKDYSQRSPSPHSHSVDSNHSTNSNTSANNNNTTTKRQAQPHHTSPIRPSSIKDHSEDSNSSCTSRKEEVVDETKVNPKVPQGPLLWPAWVYCTRYSDRPSSGPRSRRVRKKDDPDEKKPRETDDQKRPRTAFTADQLQRLKKEFEENRYLTEKRRQDLARDLRLHENQIKIWFQNKRAKLKKSTGSRGGLAIQLMAQGLYNHSTVPIDEDDEMYEAMMQQQ